ncbi:SCAN domain-containing protein 3-like [Gastrophryne carolinensis]
MQLPKAVKHKRLLPVIPEKLQQQEFDIVAVWGRRGTLGFCPVCPTASLLLCKAKGGSKMSTKQTSLESFLGKKKRPSEETEEQPSTSKKHKTFHRLYHESYLKYGFIGTASTVTRRIEEIAEDIETQLLERINTSPWYALQVDESTDIDNKAILLVYVRYIYQEDVHEDLLCALSLPTTTTGAELFKALDGYISGQLKWSFCVGICRDGAAAMIGRLSGLTARIKEVAPESESTHCIIHREMLASRKMSPELNSVLIDVVKVINHIKAHALNSCLFEQLCEEMEAEHRCLLLYTEIRWLSRGKSLSRVFELREPLQRFLSEKKSPLAAHFSDKVWVAKPAYLCDIFSLLNELNLSLQGKMTTIFKLADKVAAFKAKLELWGRRVNREFEHYFPTTKDPRTGKEWIRDPFINKPGESSMSVQEEEQLLEIANDGGLKSTFETTTLPVFWIKAMPEYPEIATTALKSLLPFPTSYLCEAGFSAVTATKTKQRNKLDISKTLRVSLSPITPRWNRLVAEKQAQGSH